MREALPGPRSRHKFDGRLVRLSLRIGIMTRRALDVPALSGRRP